MNRLLRNTLTAVAIAGYSFFFFPAAAWGETWSADKAALNQTVDQTNFIVDGRCSGTLISLVHRLVLTANHCVTHKVKSYTVEEVVDGVLTKVKKRRLLDLKISQKNYIGSRQVGSVEYMAEIAARAEAKDLALLRIRAETLPYTVSSPFLPLDADLQRGETVWSVGNPARLDASVSSGVISSLTRMFRVPWANNEEIPFIQYDALGAPGSSGGALYNDKGYLIGVVVAGHRGVPIGYAVHPNSIREFLDDSCYPVYAGGEIDEDKCAAFGEFKEEDSKDSAQ